MPYRLNPSFSVDCKSVSRLAKGLQLFLVAFKSDRESFCDLRGNEFSLLNLAYKLLGMFKNTCCICLKRIKCFLEAEK